MSQFESSCRKGHSIETAFVRVHNDTVNAVDKGRSVCLILLDLAAAFDTGDHTILCDFLENHMLSASSDHTCCQNTTCISEKVFLSEMNRLNLPMGYLKTLFLDLSNFVSIHSFFLPY